LLSLRSGLGDPDCARVVVYLDAVPAKGIKNAVKVANRFPDRLGAGAFHSRQRRRVNAGPLGASSACFMPSASTTL
jgi:hypothetical protein